MLDVKVYYIYCIHDIYLRIAGSSTEDPIQAFVELEAYNSSALLQHVHRSLSGLSRVIRGAALLDSSVSTLADSLLRRETPANWQRQWDGPEDPMNYMRAICGKTTEVRRWMDASKQVRKMAIFFVIMVAI